MIVTSCFRDLGIKHFEAACEFVKNLKYERISDKSDPLLVLKERRGTCSSKHALLKMFADENGLAYDLKIGIYKMCPDNTAGLDDVFPPDLDYIPEAHTYLFDGEKRVDMTRKNSEPLEDVDILKEITISVEELISNKEAIHRSFLREWCAEKGLKFADIWRSREECIERLSI